MADIASVEQAPAIEGRAMSMVLVPSKLTGKAKQAEAEAVPQADAPDSAAS
jgi:hypothetical protein